MVGNYYYKIDVNMVHVSSLIVRSYERESKHLHIDSLYGHIMQNEHNYEAEHSLLADRISKVVIDKFNGLNIKSGKPTVRSNGVQEWTVLAGLVALISTNDQQEPEIYPISLATGVKALPNRVREYSEGSIVHDLHAEILAIRLFNWYLLDECFKVSAKDTEYTSKIIEKSQNNRSQFKLKDNINLALLVTEPPCGDASISYLTETLEDKEPWKDEAANSSKRQKLNSDLPVTRGRTNFDKLGIVRTKPGRSDSVITLSKSCSDKLCLKQLIGVTNAITSLLFPDSIYLSYLVLPKHKFKEEDINRCFNLRFTHKLEGQMNIHPLKVIGYSKDDYPFHKPKINFPEVPSQLSLLHIIPSKYTQILNNGVKNGAFVKNKRPKTNGESIICNKQVYKKAQSLLDQGVATYTNLKNSNTRRQELKMKGRETLNYWVSTDVDDFDLL